MNYSLDQNLFFLLGLFAGMDSLAITLGNFSATFFTIILFITVLYRFLVTKKLIFDRKNPLVWYFLFGSISSIVSSFLLPSEWGKSNINAVISNLFGICGILCTSSHESYEAVYEPFIKGLKVNIIIQAFWGLLQFIGENFFHLSINSIFHLRGAREISANLSQVSGLGWERATFCLLMIFGYILFRKSWQKLLCILNVIFSQSRTGLLLIAIVIVLSIDYSKIQTRIKTSKGKIISYFISLVVVVFSLILARKIIASNFASAFQRFENLGGEASSYTHMMYFRRTPEIFKEQDIFYSLFGYGFSGSGYPYTLYVGINSSLGAWSVESTILSILYSTGIIGFVIWFVWMIEKLRITFIHSKKLFSVFLSVLIGGLTYSLLPNWSFLILIILSENVLKFSNLS